MAKGWLDNFGKDDNYNDYQTHAPKGFEGDGYSNVGRNSSPAWGGQFQMGGVMPGAVGNMYARHGAPSKGPRRNQTDVTDASAQNGKEMQYYQEGLDFQPKTISQNGTSVKYGTPEYEEAYNKGEIVGENGELSPIQLNEVIVKGKPLSDYGKIRKEQEAKQSWEQFANDRYLGNFEKGQGQTLENLPQSDKDEYEKYIDTEAFNEYTKKFPKQHGEKRGDYINRIKELNTNNTNFDRAYEANAEYNPSTDDNLWHKSLVGLGSIVAPSMTQSLKQSGHYYSDEEKRHMLENPNSTKLGDVLGTLAPLEIPANMMYGKNNGWMDALSGQGTDVPIEARLLGDPAIMAIEAAPLISKGYSAIKNSELASNVINKGKNVLEGSKQIGKDIYGLASGERRSKIKKLSETVNDLSDFYRSPEFGELQIQERNLDRAKWELKDKVENYKNNQNTIDRDNINTRLNKARGREDIAKLFTVNNEGLVQSGKDTALGLRTGSTDIVDFSTGKTHSISADVPNDNIRFDLEGNKVVKTIGNSEKIELSPEYTSTVKNNINFIEDKIPGAKVFGSAKNVAEAEIPHLIGDYDVIMSQSEYNKFAKTNPKISNNGFAAVHDIPGAAKGVDPIDINVIEEVKGKATGQRAKELFRQVAPDEFYKAAKASIKSNSEIKIPYSSEELVNMTDPSSKSIVDAYESTKQKHLNKIDALINYGKPSVVKAGQEQYIKSLVGSKGTLGHQFPLEQLSDANRNSEILDEINFIGNKKLAASNPERMQLALNDYYINQSVLVRQVNKGKIDKVEAAIKEYNPGSGGGAVMGIGQNHVTLGFPHHGYDNVTSVKQLGLTLDKTDPLSYVASIKHQTSGEQLFNENEQKILSDIVDSLKDSSVKGEGINLMKGAGSSKDMIKQSKNTSELIRNLPYDEEGKIALYDFAKQTGRHMAKSDSRYGTSNFSVTLRDFDDAIDAMQYTTRDQVEMEKTLKSYIQRKEAFSGNNNDAKLIDDLLPKQFKGIKGYLEGGSERAKARMAKLYDERAKIDSDITELTDKTHAKKYKEDIEKFKKYRQEVDEKINSHKQMRDELDDRLTKLNKFKEHFQNTLMGGLGVGTLGGIYALHKYEQSPEQEAIRAKEWENVIKKQDAEIKLLKKLSPAERKKREEDNKGVIQKSFDWMMGVKHKDGGIINSDRGQWDHPGKITRIKGSNITMRPDPKTGKRLTQPLLGISDTGEQQMMYPGKDYNFEGANYVTEYPKGKLAKNGLRQEQKGLQNLDNLTNFTNYNTKQPGGWLDQY